MSAPLDSAAPPADDAPDATAARLTAAVAYRARCDAALADAPAGAGLDAMAQVLAPARRHLPVVDPAPAPDHGDSRGRRRRGGARARTISIARGGAREMAAGRVLYPPTDEYQRPQTRGDCLAGGSNAARPCPWVSCTRHLAVEVDDYNGNIKLNFPDLEVWEMGETCSLDVADRGGVTLAEAGDALNLTRERIRQVEAIAMGLLSDSRRVQRIASDALGLVGASDAEPDDASGARSTGDALASLYALARCGDDGVPS